MSRRKKAKARAAAREKADNLVRLYQEADWDEEFHRELHGITKCFKCGSQEFEEILDDDKGLVVCCSDCPEEDEHH